MSEIAHFGKVNNLTESDSSMWQFTVYQRSMISTKKIKVEMK